MPIRRYVDSFVGPTWLLSTDNAKEQLIEKLKNKLVDELEINEKMRTSQVKLERQLKIEAEKNLTLEATIKMLRMENSKLNQGQHQQHVLSSENTPDARCGTKRQRLGCDEPFPIESGVSTPRNSTDGHVQLTASSTLVTMTR